MSDSKTFPMMCGCGRAVAVPACGPMEDPQPARHIGVPGNPVECPK